MTMLLNLRYIITLLIVHASLTMDAKVTNITKLVFFHLSQVRQLAPYLSRPSLATKIHALVTSRLCS